MMVCKRNLLSKNSILGIYVRFRGRGGYIQRYAPKNQNSYNLSIKHREGFSVLGGGNSPIFHVHLQTLGIHDPLDLDNLTRASFFRRVGERPPTSVV